MLVSINWIKDFVNLPKTVDQELAKRFTLATCEVENVKMLNAHFSSVLVAQILKIEDHPDSEKLHLVTIDLKDKTTTVVCGAPNVAVGIKVPYAPIGTTLPNGITLEPKKIRGILSEGMLCSEAELALGDDDLGLLIFPTDAPTGQTLETYLNTTTDIIFEIDNKSLTNRPDLWCHYGLAREFATVFQADLKTPFDQEWENQLLKKIPNTPSPIKHHLKGESACKGYWGLSISGIKITESPKWMQQRLLACGLRPINSIVDISNYVLLELGMPNHIFDRSKIEGGQIIVKKAEADLQMTTLDGVSRNITTNDTLICDVNRPLAIAGIMGGLDSSITDSTTDIFIECANFTDVAIRKTSSRLGLRSDSSLRFEKSLDTHLLKRSILRIMELVLQLNPQATVEGSLLYDGEDLSVPLPKVKIEIDKISRVLGKEVDIIKIVDILNRLGFDSILMGEELEITIPSWRATKDVSCEADIIEEIGRIIGFDNIIPKAPTDTVKPTSLSIQKQIHRKIVDFMVLHANAQEIMSYPMIGKPLLSKTGWPQDNLLVLKNAISTDHDRMRPSLVPSLLEILQLNAKNEHHFCFFEIGRIYKPDEATFSKEENWLGAVFFDKKENQIMQAINITEQLISFLKISAKIVEQPSNNIFPNEWVGLHPYEHLCININGKCEGAILSLHPQLKTQLKLKGEATLLLLRLTNFENRLPKSNFNYAPLPKFPGSEFDCTVVASPSEPVKNVQKIISSLPIKEIKEVKIVGVFPLSETEKTITIKTRFLDPQRTLDGQFLEEAKNKIVETLNKNGFPLKQ